MDDQNDEQAVLIYLKLSDDQLGSADERDELFKLEDILIPIVENMGAEYDGHEFGKGFATLRRGHATVARLPKTIGRS